MKLKKFVLDILRGIGIGVAAIIPGVSGGSVAVIFKIYEKLVGAIHKLFKNFVKSFLILLPIVIGIAVGFLSAVIPIKYALEHFMLVIVSLFAGLLIGSVPDMFKYVKDEKPKYYQIIICVISFLFAVGIGVLSVTLKASTQIDALFNAKPWYLYPILFFAGLLAACGFVVPGISGSMLMMIIGFYDNVVNLFSNILHGIDLGSSILMLVFVGLGVIVGFFSISILMDVLLKKFKTSTYWAIIGFIIGSISSLFVNNDLLTYVTLKDPETELYLISNWEFILSPLMLAIGFTISYCLIKFANNKIKKEQENA